MKKDLFQKSGELLHGKDWVSPLSAELNINRKTIQRYNSGENAVNQNLTPEIIALLNVQKASIENTIIAIEEDIYIDEKVDLTKSFIVVSDNGTLFDEQFKTIEAAQAWVNEEYEVEDQYLISFHQMTVAEQFALETMRYFSDVYNPEDVLKAIQSGQFEKSEQEYYLDLCKLDENHLGREYYAYYIANEFNLSNKPSLNLSDDDDFSHSKTISYKLFILKHIANLSKYVAEHF